MAEKIQFQIIKSLVNECLKYFLYLPFPYRMGDIHRNRPVYSGKKVSPRIFQQYFFINMARHFRNFFFNIFIISKKGKWRQVNPRFLPPSMKITAQLFPSAAGNLMPPGIKIHIGSAVILISQLFQGGSQKITGLPIIFRVYFHCQPRPGIPSERNAVCPVQWFPFFFQHPAIRFQQQTVVIAVKQQKSGRLCFFPSQDSMRTAIMGSTVRYSADTFPYPGICPGTDHRILPNIKIRRSHQKPFP